MNIQKEILAAILLLIVSFAQAQTVEYIHTDALGSPVAVTNASGAVIERTVYEPYGAVINRPVTNGPGYTGHVMDATTGLNYMQQRYYDPQVGRFLSNDPVTATSVGGNFNRYSYAANNPYRFVDPDGRQQKCPPVYWKCYGGDAGGESSGSSETSTGGSTNAGGFTQDEIETGVYTRQRLAAIHQNATAVADAVSVVTEEGYKLEAGGRLFAAIASVRLLPKSRRFFRLNLVASTGKNPGPEWIAHHGLPVEFEKAFNRLGIKNIHDPKWGIWTHSSMHTSKQWHDAYNASWRIFLDTNPSVREIERQWTFQKWLIDLAKEVP